MNRHKANVVEDIERLDIRTYYECPDLLEFKYKQEVDNPNPLKSLKFV